MQSVPIQAIPNQSLSVIVDNNTWALILKTAGDSTVISLKLNGADIINNVRAVAGSLIIPSQYEESGNFFFTTQNLELPFYSSFNITQSLLYVSASELSVYRTQPVPPITSSYFNPIAALPLRFAPVGYVAA